MPRGSTIVCVDICDFRKPPPHGLEPATAISPHHKRFFLRGNTPLTSRLLLTAPLRPQTRDIANCANGTAVQTDRRDPGRTSPLLAAVFRVHKGWAVHANYS
jgi:hypothetical protein